MKQTNCRTETAGVDVNVSAAEIVEYSPSKFGFDFPLVQPSAEERHYLNAEF